MARLITPEESQLVDTLLARGRAAMTAIDGCDQAMVDRLCQAIAWAAASRNAAPKCWAFFATHFARRAWA